MAAPAHGLVRDDRAQPARGVALARVLDLLREDVERGEHAAAGDEGHRHRSQRRVVPWCPPGLARACGPGLLVERADPLEQRGGQLVLGVDEDRWFEGHRGRLPTR